MRICSAFGHRDLLCNIEKELYSVIISAAKNGCNIFYTGFMGNFDRKFAYCVQKAKSEFPHIKLICVIPYFSNRINTHKKYYYDLFDEIIIPEELNRLHYKAAIKSRNRWMIDKSDTIIFYLEKNYGGAFDAYKYSLKLNKNTIKIKKSGS